MVKIQCLGSWVEDFGITGCRIIGVGLVSIVDLKTQERLPEGFKRVHLKLLTSYRV